MKTEVPMVSTAVADNEIDKDKTMYRILWVLMLLFIVWPLASFLASAYVILLIVEVWVEPGKSCWWIKVLI